MQEQLNKIRAYLETTSRQERDALAAYLLQYLEQLETAENEAFADYRSPLKGRAKAAAIRKYAYESGRYSAASDILQILAGEFPPLF